MFKFLSTGIIALTIALVAPTASAFNYSGPAGSGGGTAWGDDLCASGWLTGVHGTSGKYVDSLGIYCGAENRFGPTHGGGGGGYAVSTCPAGYAVKGITGGHGKYIDRLRLTCVRQSDRIGEVMAPYQFGGPGGSDYTRRCPANEMAIGMRGRAGKYLDQLELVCWNAPQ